MLYSLTAVIGPVLSTYNGSGYALDSGTSMAASHVAGAAALYKAMFPDTTPAQVMANITNPSIQPHTHVVLKDTLQETKMGSTNPSYFRGGSLSLWNDHSNNYQFLSLSRLQLQYLYS